MKNKFIIYRLNAYSRNLRKEISKAGKWYFFDNGIRNAIIKNFNPIAIRQDVGAMWENYIINERIKANNNNGLEKEFYFWRTYDKQEIDLIEESPTTINAIECKWNNKKNTTPKAFSETYPNAECMIINKENYLNYIL